MHIVLIHPPWSEVYGKYKAAARVGVLYPPLGLCYIASVLEDQGHKVTLIDAEAEEMDAGAVVQEVIKTSPDIVGITSTTPLFDAAKNLAIAIKDTLDIPIIIGGPHVTVMPMETMQSSQAFDFGVIGEGERTCAELIKALENKSPVDAIQGIIFRKDGKPVQTESRPMEPDLDTILPPNRSLLKLQNYLWAVPHRGVEKFTTIQTTRGCPFMCNFCSQHAIFGRKVRNRSTESILEEIEYIVKDLGIRHLHMIDETLTLDHQHMEEICKGIIDRKLDFTWEGWTRANTVNEEILSLMNRAGFIRISFGIESGDPEILKKINKGVKLEDFEKAYRISKKVGLETRGSAIIGHPYETRQTAMNTLRFIRRLKDCDQIYLNIATPYPGSELYDMAIKGEGGLRLLSTDFSEYKRYGGAVIEVNDLSANDLIKLQKKGFMMFYFTPRRIWYNLHRAGFRAGASNAWAFARSMVGV